MLNEQLPEVYDIGHDSADDDVGPISSAVRSLNVDGGAGWARGTGGRFGCFFFFFVTRCLFFYVYVLFCFCVLFFRFVFSVFFVIFFGVLSVGGVGGEWGEFSWISVAVVVCVS